MEDDKIISGSMSDCQKWLNQWKHEFTIIIYQMCIRESGDIVILLTRTKNS